MECGRAAKAGSSGGGGGGVRWGGSPLSKATSAVSTVLAPKINGNSFGHSLFLLVAPHKTVLCEIMVILDHFCPS